MAEAGLAESQSIQVAQTHWVCSRCARPVPTYVGRCPGCRLVNTLRTHDGPCPELPRRKPPAQQDQFAGLHAGPRVMVEDRYVGSRPIGEVEEDFEPCERILTGVSSLDRVLGPADPGAALGAVVLIGGSPGVGKCLGEGTVVMMSDGSTKKVEDVRVGDRLMGPDSSPRKVLSTNAGVGPLYIIRPIKGEPWVCNDQHVLTLTGTRKTYVGKTIDVPLYEHIANCERRHKRLDHDWKLFRVPVSFKSVSVPIDPYLLGLWIGDGTTGEANITNREPEIISYCKSIADQHGIRCRLREEPQKNSWTIIFRRWRSGAKQLSFNPLRRFFKKCVTADGSKMIPREFIINDEDKRLALLAGIIDTDGYLNGEKCCYDLATVYESLAEQILFLARSLGFAAYSKKCRKGCQTGAVGTYYRITISGDVDRIPCRVERRKAAPRRQIKRVLVTGFSAEPIGDGRFYGFTLDGDGRFLLGDFTVTHNSSVLLQALAGVAERGETALFVSSEQTMTEIVQFADRLGILSDTTRRFLRLVYTSSFEEVEQEVEMHEPVMLVLDSLNDFATIREDGKPGSMSQAVAVMKAVYQLTTERKISTFVVSQVTKDGDFASSNQVQHEAHVVARMRLVDDPMERYPLEQVAGSVNGNGEPLDFVELVCPEKNRFGKRRIPGYFVVGDSGLLQSVEPREVSNRRWGR